MPSFNTLKFGLFLFSLTVVIVLSKWFGFHFIGLKQLQYESPKRGSNERFFTIDFVENTFLKDNKPFQYISGSIHYSRVPQIYWWDRLQKMKAAGLNTIQIYVPWNFHEFHEGQYEFTGNKDLNMFLTMAESLDLLVLLRSGPYMCGEWDFGGLPAWLLKKNPYMKIRSSDPVYMSAVSKWYSQLLPILKPHLYQNNGSIIMVQVENEYGSFPACDNAYLRGLYDLVRGQLGNDVIIYSTDGNGMSYLVCGSSDRRIFSTVDFGPGGNPEASFHDLEIFQPRGPLVNSEYYSGWLDSWGRKHNSVPTSNVVEGLKSLYGFSNSVNINMYMFHGGTSFGFWNGANALPYLPQITSYDYDAPLSEAGDTTWKYYAIRNYIQSINPTIPLPPVPPNSTKVAYGRYFLTQNLNFLRNLLSQNVTTYQYPLTMEMMDQFQGLMAYVTSTRLQMDNIGARENQISVLEFSRIGDYAYIFTGNSDNTEFVYQGSVDRNMAKLTLNINVGENLIVLVENSGHINYGSYMINDVKGIIGNVRLNNVILTKWKHYPVNISPTTITMNSVPANKMSRDTPSQAGMFTSYFIIANDTADTFAYLPDFGKGFLVVNGVNLGRYWNNKGPQYTLYTPKSVLKQGVNSILVLELEGTRCSSDCFIEFIDYPILNGPVHL